MIFGGSMARVSVMTTHGKRGRGNSKEKSREAKPVCLAKKQLKDCLGNVLTDLVENKGSA